MKEIRIEANGKLGPINAAEIPRYAGAATWEWYRVWKDLNSRINEALDGGTS